MSKTDRIFADDWRDCLREQYRYVLQQQDARTETTLTHVLHEVGFGDDELAALKLQATIRADEMPEDYLPDDSVQRYYAGVEAPEAVPEDVVEVVDEPPLEMEIMEAALDGEPEAEAIPFDEPTLEDLPDAVLDELIEPEADEDDDAPQQLSLF